MGLLLLYWAAMAIAYIVASKNRHRADKLRFMQSAIMPVVYILVLIMGLRMGVNEQVTSNLGSIGIQAAVITVFTVGGSILAVTIARKFIRMNKYGDILKDEQSTNECESKLGDKADNSLSKSDIMSTVIILVLVGIGMLIGYMMISRVSEKTMVVFDTVSENSLVVFLTVLLFLVGFDLGMSGMIGGNIRSVGIKVIVFPIAAVAGSLIVGTIISVVMGFSIREGIAISAGFGWYTYAPTVIAAAGNEYMVASAVSFMHNVIREVGGIVFIPLLAKKIGYIESAAIPGVAAMDVCMPIVERSCRHDTVVYSLAIGLFMCIATSTLVPIIMGI